MIFVCSSPSLGEARWGRNIIPPLTPPTLGGELNYACKAVKESLFLRFNARIVILTKFIFEKRFPNRAKSNKIESGD